MSSVHIDDVIVTSNNKRISEFEGTFSKFISIQGSGKVTLFFFGIDFCIEKCVNILFMNVYGSKKLKKIRYASTVVFGGAK